MADLYDDHEQFLRRNLIDDPIIAHTDSIKGLLGLEFLAASRIRIFRKAIYAPLQSLLGGSVESREISQGPRSEPDRVGHGGDALKA
jgi:hypothetical protein